MQAGRKAIEWRGQACLAWLGEAKAADYQALLLQKNNPPVFCFGFGPRRSTQTCIGWFNRK
jgi:hypothetical protein